MKIIKNYLVALAALMVCLVPNISLACACGCSMFDVGTASTLPTQMGTLVSLEYDYINQNHNWHKTGSASNDENDDKKITSQIYTASLQHMFNKKWGLMAKVPYVKRSVTMANEDGGDDEMLDMTNSKFTHNSIGDVKLMGIYSGFSANMSSGIIFGAKLPSGATKQNGLDSDMQIGTGSADAILGGYHIAPISKDGKWNYFVQGTWEKAMMTKKDYSPGREISVSSAVYYDFGKVGIFSKFAPMLQFIGSDKKRDSGLNSNTINSGYTRIFVAPGIQVNIGQTRIYSDIELPIYENVNGNQLAVAKIFKLVVGYKF